MAFTNWTLHGDTGVSAALVVAAQPDPDPPSGASWLHLAFANVQKGGAMFPDGTLPHGSLQGQYRSLVRFETSGSHAGSAIGLMAMLSQEDTRTGQGAVGYGAFLHDGTQREVLLVKLTNGLNRNTWTTLASNVANLWSYNTTYALEIQYDAVNAITSVGGVAFTVRLGTATDYSDLVTVAGIDTVFDLSAPLVATVGEAPGAWRETGAFDAYFDRTQLYVP